jgi:hypothetical protein
MSIEVIEEIVNFGDRRLITDQLGLDGLWIELVIHLPHAISWWTKKDYKKIYMAF